MSIDKGRFECELSRLSEPMSGLYGSATAGFVGRCLELCGASPPRFHWRPLAQDGKLRGTPTVKTTFIAEY